MSYKLIALTFFALSFGHIPSGIAAEQAENSEEKSSYGKTVKSMLGNQYRVNTFLSKSQLLAIEQEAEAGDVNSALTLAFYYQKPAFSQPDMTKSLKWMEKAYELGHAEAAFQLAKHCESGKFVQQDLDKALRYYAFAVVNGHSQGYLSIALLLTKINGPLSKVESIAKYMAKLDKDNTGKHIYLIMRLFVGNKSVTEDLSFAQAGYEIAIEYGSTRASFFYAKRRWLGDNEQYDFDRAKPYIDEYLKRNKYWANELAWSFCTAYEEKYRQSEYGLQVISSVQIKDNEFDYLDTYAACMAANGKFDKAAKLQQEIIDKLIANSQSTDGYVERLDFYLNEKVYIYKSGEQKKETETK